MHSSIRTLAIALAASLTMPALAAPSDDLKRVMDEHWQWSLAQSPMLATSVGDKRYDDKLGDPS